MTHGNAMAIAIEDITLPTGRANANAAGETGDSRADRIRRLTDEAAGLDRTIDALIDRRDDVMKELRGLTVAQAMDDVRANPARAKEIGKGLLERVVSPEEHAAMDAINQTCIEA